MCIFACFWLPANPAGSAGALPWQGKITKRRRFSGIGFIYFRIYW
jgi:hypothetical protein